MVRLPAWPTFASYPLNVSLRNMSRKCSCEYFDVTPQVKNYPGHRDIGKYSCQVCKRAKYVCLSCDAAFKEIWMFKRKCCATMNNTHDVAYAVGSVSSSCGESKIALTFDFRGQDAIVSTTTNYPSNYVESTDNAKNFLTIQNLPIIPWLTRVQMTSLSCNVCTPKSNRYNWGIELGKWCINELFYEWKQE